MQRRGQLSLELRSISRKYRKSIDASSLISTYNNKSLLGPIARRVARGQILASFPRLVADAFFAHPVETISRPFSAAFSPRVSKSTFGGNHPVTTYCSKAWQRAVFALPRGLFHGTFGRRRFRRAVEAEDVGQGGAACMEHGAVLESALI